MLTKLTKGGLLPRRSFCAKTNCFRANGNRGTPRKRVMSPKTLRSLYIYIWIYVCVRCIVDKETLSHVYTVQYVYIYIYVLSRNGSSHVRTYVIRHGRFGVILRIVYGFALFAAIRIGDSANDIRIPNVCLLMFFVVRLKACQRLLWPL